jgi:hypothetical protein
VLRKADVDSKVLPGYVQAENRLCGTKILFTEDQLKELARCDEEITLHMDATGSIIKKNKNEKPFLYHAVVFSKGEGNPPLPAIEMISQENSTTQVADMLTHLRNDFKKINNKELTVKRIVTDQSWPNINAILSAFQLGNIEEYLNKLWELDSSQYTGTVIKLCYAHIMKNISSKAKKYLPFAKSKERFTLLVLFSRMADCTTKDELEKEFKLLAKLLLSPTLNPDAPDDIDCSNQEHLEDFSEDENETGSSNNDDST